MTVHDFFKLRLVVFVLLFGARRHILHVLLFVQGNFHRSTVGVHALQDLSVLHTCLKESWIQGEVNALFYPFMLCEWVNALLL